MKTDMVKKLWVNATDNIYVTVAFVFVSWALVDTYRVGEWGWFAFFALCLPIYILKLAKTGAAYDIMKRRGDI